MRLIGLIGPVGLISLITAACSSDVPESASGNGPLPIEFQMGLEDEVQVSMKTVDTNPLAATKKHFKVYGINGTVADGVFSKSDVVFNNYVVWLPDGSIDNAQTWGYVGEVPATAEYAGVPATSSQAIKYWDMTKDRNIFWAVAGANHNGYRTESPNSDIADNGLAQTYTTHVSGPTDMLFTRPTIVNKVADQFENPVRLQFVRFASQIRVGFYEASSGYKVKIMRFYKDGNHHTDEANKSELVVYGSNVTEGTPSVTYPPFISSGQYTLTYGYDPVGVTSAWTVGTTTSSTVLSIGTYPMSDFVSNVSSAPTYPTAGGFMEVLPYENRKTPITVKCDYSLTPVDPVTGIEIAGGNVTNVYGREATIDVKYCQWEPGYAYTYIFKITDSHIELDQEMSVYTKWQTGFSQEVNW